MILCCPQRTEKKTEKECRGALNMVSAVRRQAFILADTEPIVIYYDGKTNSSFSKGDRI